MTRPHRPHRPHRPPQAPTGPQPPAGPVSAPHRPPQAPRHPQAPYRPPTGPTGPVSAPTGPQAPTGPHRPTTGPPQAHRPPIARPYPRKKADNGKCQELIQAIVGLGPRFSLFWETDCPMVFHFPTRGDPRLSLAFPKLSSKIGENLGNWIYDIPFGYSLLSFPINRG